MVVSASLDNLVCGFIQYWNAADPGVVKTNTMWELVPSITSLMVFPYWSFWAYCSYLKVGSNLLLMQAFDLQQAFPA